MDYVLGMVIRLYGFALVLTVLAFYAGRASIGAGTLSAASDESAIEADQGETVAWLKQRNPLDYARYKVSYLSRPFDESSAVQETVSFFAGSYALPGGGGYYKIDSTDQGDLDGDGVEEGVAIKYGNFGGTGHFPELVVLRKANNAFEEVASTNEPIEFFFDRVSVESLEVLDGVIKVKIMKRGANDAACCPRVPAEASFTLQDGRLAVVH